jgi:hypothetical protein
MVFRTLAFLLKFDQLSVQAFDNFNVLSQEDQKLGVLGRQAETEPVKDSP